MRRLGVLAITCIGLLAIWQSISYLGFAVMSSLGGGFAESFAGAAPAVVAFGFALLLISRRAELADWLFDDEPVDFALYPIPLLRTALIVLGVSIVAQKIPSIAGTISFVAAAQREGLEAPGAGQEVVVPAVSLLVGLLLVAVSKPLARVLWSAQHTGVPLVGEHLACASCGKPYDPHDYQEGAVARCVDCGEQLKLPDA